MAESSIYFGKWDHPIQVFYFSDKNGKS